jgi:hypothetical protein
MSNNEKTNGFHALKVSKFDHSSTTPRATRWREWVVKLEVRFRVGLSGLRRCRSYASEIAFVRREGIREN